MSHGNLALLAAGAGLLLAAARPGGAGAAAPSVREAAARLAERGRTPVLLDPAVALQPVPREPEAGLPLEAALGALAGSLREAAFRRLELASRPGEALPPAAELARIARALERLRTGSLLIEDPSGGRLTFALKEVPAARWAAAPAGARPSSEKAAYLLYSTAAGVPVVERLADLERQQLSLPVPEGQETLAMAQVMELIRNEEPARVEQAFASLHQAGMRLWEQVPREERDEMMGVVVGLMSRSVPPRAPRAASGAAPRPANAEAELWDLKARLTSLAARQEATVRIDPALFLSGPAPRFARDTTLEKALEQVTAAAPGTGWRRVYLSAADLRRVPPAEQLAAAVRAFDRPEAPAAAYHDPASKRVAASWQRRGGEEAAASAARQWRLGAKPLTLLYSTQPSSRGTTALERLADLQRQQVGLMLGLDAEQLAGSLARLLQDYQAADPARRERILGLPLMAGLMGTWFPREAKERGGQGR